VALRLEKMFALPDCTLDRLEQAECLVITGRYLNTDFLVTLHSPAADFTVIVTVDLACDIDRKSAALVAKFLACLWVTARSTNGRVGLKVI